MSHQEILTILAKSVSEQKLLADLLQKGHPHPCIFRMCTTTIASCKTPGAVLDFIKKFDNGGYPDLDEVLFQPV